MEAKRGVMSCVFVIVLLIMAACSSGQSSRYEVEKRQNWNKFLKYLKNHKPPLTLEHCSGSHVIEYLKFLDHFGVTRVHVPSCPYYGNPTPYARCAGACPLKQTWTNLRTLIGKLRVAYWESGGQPKSNPFDASVVKIYLRQVRECQIKARGIPAYQPKKPKRKIVGEAGASSGGAGSEPTARPPLVKRLFYVRV